MKTKKRIIALSGAASAYHQRCLGGCDSCLQYVSDMPKGLTGITQDHYLDYKSVDIEQMAEFFETKELCSGNLAPISTNLETFSLSEISLNGEYDDRIEKIPGGLERASMVREGCLWLQNLAQKFYLAGMRRKIEAVVESAPGQSEQTSSATGDVIAYKQFVAESLEKMQNSAIAFAERQEESTAGNYTIDLVVRHIHVAQEVPVIDDSEGLLAASMEVAKRARLLVDNAKTFLGVTSSVSEWKASSPDGKLQWPVPTFTWHDHFGRHWDVLQILLERYENLGRPMRFAEVGIACASIGLFMLQRFPNLEYVGIDPSIGPDTERRINVYGDRATLYRNISEEIAPTYPDNYFDLVFVDGPHTFKNVQNDIYLWNRKVQPRGILAGHDFSANHPPLLAAVISSYWGGHINVAMDGVWWWEDYPRFEPMV